VPPRRAAPAHPASRETHRREPDIVSARPLDRDRFAKCRALMERGATAGERQAGRAAATRVAAAAGLSLAEALLIVDTQGVRPEPRAEARPPRPKRPARPYAWAQPKSPPEPITVEELLRQKEAELQRRKRAAARETKRMRAAFAEQEQATEAVRQAQAARDREWAERRKPRPDPTPPSGAADQS
jgi:hypothetical protein